MKSPINQQQDPTAEERVSMMMMVVSFDHPNGDYEDDAYEDGRMDDCHRESFLG